MSAIVSRQIGLEAEAEDIPHRHDHGQFILVRRGILHGHVERNTWVLQAGMAAWIPPGLEHWGRASKSVELAALYLPHEQCQNFPQAARPLLASSLMIALCERLIAGAACKLAPDRAERMMILLVEEIADAPAAGLVLPLPSDPRLKRLTEALIANPPKRLTLAEWGRQVGATERTLMRLFRRETGLRFGEWYDRLLLAEAVRGLADGLSNDRMAVSLGFSSGDSFGHWFRRVTGGSPGRFTESLILSGERMQLAVSFDKQSDDILHQVPSRT